jgi:cytidine deaminase
VETVELSALDRDLIEETKRTADRFYLEDTHKVAAALRTRSGEVFSGINIAARMPFADVCGEVAALCAMVAAGHREPEVIVAIHRDGGGPFELFPPCGRCRELISDFDLDTWVIVGKLEQPFKVKIAELLPFKAG